MATKDQVNCFALKWLAKFQDISATERSVTDGFAEDCFALGFKMDCGQAFDEAYPSASQGVKELEAIIDQVDDIPLLGSGIFSRWRYVTHWDQYASLLDANYRPWFIVALTRLASISEGEQKLPPLFVGSPVKMRLVSNRIGYGPCPEPDDEVEQRLVIHSTGKACISRYLNGPGAGGKPIRKSTRRLCIPLENALDILNRLKDYYSSYHELAFVTDVGTWDLFLTNSDGKTFRYTGFFCAEEGSFFSDISRELRGRLNMPDIYAFDGNYVEDRIERIELDYRRVRKLKPPETFDPDSVYATWNYGERITINRADDTIEYFQKIAQECDVLRRYHVLEGVSYFLDSWDVGTLFKRFYEAPTDAAVDPLDVNEYTLTVNYLYGSPLEITGIYDRDGLPTDWPKFMEELVDFLNFYSAGELVAPSIYAARRRRMSDLMYCSIEFDPGGKTYYYISNDPGINEDDIVEVPVGKDNTISTGKVVDVEYFSPEDAPLEPNKVKLIIRRIDNE